MVKPRDTEPTLLLPSSEPGKKKAKTAKPKTKAKAKAAPAKKKR